MDARLTGIVLLVLTLACVGLCDEDPLIFSTKECFLTEPIYNHKFDFGALRSDLGHQVVSSKGDIFEYNICGNINRSCNGQSEVRACLKRADKEYILGTEHELNYRNGKIYLTYLNGSKCPNSTGNFQFHVFIGCDYTMDAEQAHITSYADDACSFYVNLETELACLPEPDAVKSNVCSVQDPNSRHIYNLLPLSDYNYRLSDRKGSAIVLNVCKPVLYSENAMCPPGSSVCFVALQSENFQKKFFNYGTVQSNPVIENGKLLMRLQSDTHCNTTHNFSSVINFYCAKNAQNAHPELIDDSNCVYKFSFPTPLACNDNAPCTAMVHGNEVIDLSRLKDSLYNFTKDKKVYTYSVCSHASPHCMEQDGACLSESGQTTSLGLSNTNLRFNQSGSLYLLYEGGAKCQESNTGTVYWSTKIEFVCANNTTKDSSNYVGRTTYEISNCQLLIRFETPLACTEQIKCLDKAHVDHSEDGTGIEIVDLTPLIDSTNNYEAQINPNAIKALQISKTTKFLVNVCRPLVGVQGAGCAGGSSICMTNVAGGTVAIPETKSLGFPTTSLKAINRTAAQLLYSQGDLCPTDQASRLSSRIYFHCDMHAGRGTPRLDAVADCEYQFSWATNVICPPHMCAFDGKTCEIINDEMAVKFNLKEAHFTDNNGKIKMKINSNELTLDICNSHSKPITDYSQGLVNVFFSAKNACGANGSLNVQMRLICSNETKRTIIIYNANYCNLLFEQHTPEICAFLGLETPASAPQTTPSSTQATATTTVDTQTTARPKGEGEDQQPTGGTTSIGAILGAILSLTFFTACFGVLAFSPERRSALRRLFRRGTSAVRYSRVQSNEEANLLLEPNGEFTDSDDDMLL